MSVCEERRPNPATLEKRYRRIVKIATARLLRLREFLVPLLGVTPFLTAGNVDHTAADHWNLGPLLNEWIPAEELDHPVSAMYLNCFIRKVEVD